MGTSGCGKSTVFGLLQRFYEPIKGEILIDGVDIKDYDLHHLRRSLGVVSQEPPLFRESIGYNVKYNGEATQEEVEEALKLAQFFVKQDDEASAMPSQADEGREHPEWTNGLEKDVGINGSHLSGGQKQRVAIARALVRKPQVLLLDEATSALDSSTERAVQAELDRLFKGRTMVNIAHRLRTIRNSDRIVVMNRGRRIEEGSYNQLIQHQGIFYKIEQGINFI